jgi:hypothetical protein
LKQVKTINRDLGIIICKHPESKNMILTSSLLLNILASKENNKNVMHAVATLRNIKMIFFRNQPIDHHPESTGHEG